MIPFNTGENDAIPINWCPLNVFVFPLDPEIAFAFSKVAGTGAQTVFPGSPLRCLQAAESLINYVLGYCRCFVYREASQSLLCPTTQALTSEGCTKTEGQAAAAHSRFIPSSWKLETTQVSFDGWLVWQCVVHWHRGCSKKTKMLIYTTTWMDLDRIMLNKRTPVPKGYIS